MPVDCVWSRYSVWTSCSVTCGGGLRTSSRTIVQNAENGGKECQGDKVKGEKCNTDPCPGRSDRNHQYISVLFRSHFNL